MTSNTELKDLATRLRHALACITRIDEGCGGNLNFAEQAQSAMRQAAAALPIANELLSMIEAKGQAAVTASETQLMADCMAETRADLIRAGVIQGNVPPMFVADAVIATLAKLKNPPVATGEQNPMPAPAQVPQHSGFKPKAILHRFGGRITSLLRIEHATTQGQPTWFFVGTVEWSDGTGNPSREYEISPVHLIKDGELGEQEVNRVMEALNDYLFENGTWLESGGWKPNRPAGNAALVISESKPA